jgi:glucose-1-phosphate thymidylyltransferase
MDAQIILYEMHDPSSMGVAVLDGQMRVVRVVEKPKQFISPYAVIGIYMFTANVFEAVNAIKPSARGELEITDTIQYLVDKNCNVRAHLLREPWIDTGKIGDMLEANRLILEILEPRIEGSVDAQSQIVGRVVVEKGARIIESVIRGPAIIGANAVIDHAFVGPFTAIDHDCVVARAEIENSILMDSSRITDVRDRISDSLIGRFVDIHQSPPSPKAIRLMLGDHSQVGVL